MAGSINLSLSQQLDNTGKPLAGGRLFFFQAGTTTPQSAYVDSALTITYPNPIVLDTAGRIPAFFIADGQIKIRLTDKFGNVVIAADNLVVVGPSSGGGGGGGSVDPNTVFSTGDIKSKYLNGPISGWVRLNGRTIGSVTSGATERANADCEALFNLLWNNDANRPVSGGRGASSAADWAANKTIALPDGRGRVLAGLDDMGATPAGRLTSTYLIGTPTNLGAEGGSQSSTLITANLPPYTPAGSVSSTFEGVGQFARIGIPNILKVGNSGTDIDNTSLGGGVTSTFTGTPQGGISAPVTTLPPMFLLTHFIKL